MSFVSLLANRFLAIACEYGDSGDVKVDFNDLVLFRYRPSEMISSIDWISIVTAMQSSW
jgi:hypothetical protein